MQAPHYEMDVSFTRSQKTARAQNKTVSLVQIPKKIFTVFFDRNVYKTILANILEKSTEMAVLLITVPGASCYSIGYRVAVFTRFLFNIIYDEDEEQDLVDNTYELDEEIES